MSDPHMRPSWKDYDHLEMSALEEPARLLGELRAQCPVGRSDKFGGFYVLTRYADCLAAARDERFSSDIDKGPGPGFPFTHHDFLRMVMITNDGARHRDFRMPLQKIFSVKFAASLAPHVRQICDDLIDEFIETGNGDLADRYSIELPARLISELLDIPMDRRREFQNWASTMVATGDLAVTKKMVDYTAELHELRSGKPGEDIPSKMLAFEIGGRAITRDEWRGLVMLLILGGLDTTANAGGYAFQMIGVQPELRRYLIEDPRRIQGSVKEFLRLISPVPQHSRGVTADVTIGQHEFHKGDVVQLSWLAANHDPEVFEHPDRFQADRKVDNHLAFGHGAHRCLGSYIALMEMQIMIEQVLKRLPDYELVPGGTTRFPSLNRGMSHLHVTFSPGRRVKAAP